MMPRNADFPLIDRLLDQFDNAVFRFIMRHGGFPPHNRLRFWLGWRVHDWVCCPLGRWRQPYREAFVKAWDARS